jgi:hypothetical protein
MRHRASSVTVIAAVAVVASVALSASLVRAASTAKHTAAHTNSIVVSVGHGGVMQQLQQHTTVREAVEAVRALPMLERAKGVTVTLAGGDYLGPDNQLVLDARDSGIPGAPVVWVLHHTPTHSVTRSRPLHEATGSKAAERIMQIVYTLHYQRTCSCDPYPRALHQHGLPRVRGVLCVQGGCSSHS